MKVSRRLADAVIVGADSQPVADLLLQYCTKKQIQSPILLHHKMLRSLAKPAEPMSKKTPSSTVFLEDCNVCSIFLFNYILSWQTDIQKRFNKGFFDPADVESSGVTDTLSLLILPILGSITIKDRFDIMLDVSLTSLHNLFPVSFLPLMT